MAQLDFPSTSRNREPIAAVLARLWDPAVPTSFLEVASGSGQHAVYFAGRFPRWSFQPTDLEPGHLASIESYRQSTHLPNLYRPFRLDVSSSAWDLESFYHAILAINLIHIAPWRCTVNLFREGSKILCDGGRIYLYGAFRMDGSHTSLSNEEFDRGLRRSNPAWGVRSLEEVCMVARSAGLVCEDVIGMPANNLSVIFQKIVGESGAMQEFSEERAWDLRASA